MIQKEDLDSMLNHWLDKLREAIAMRNGEDMCEASRVVLGVCSILWAYHQEAFTNEIGEIAETLFNDALSCIKEDLEKGCQRDANYKLYQKNISMRLEDLRRLRERTPIV